MPGDICDEFDIYNGHPGLITKYPELKGKDPQEKAYRLGLHESGCVIHKAVAEVDSGEILREKVVSIEKLAPHDIMKILHKESINLWVDFLTEKL